jgi:FkbM family methyltransferase
VEFFRINDLLYLFTEVFIEEVYGKTPMTQVETIVDCGSNIGVSLLYFKSLYPHARILAFEACPETFQILQRNVSNNRLANVEAFNLAVSGSERDIVFYSTAGSIFGSSNELRGRGAGVSVKGFPLSSFLSETIDLLKMDVEGAELEVFPELESSGKLSLVRHLAIEYHHHLPHSSARFSDFLAILERNGFDYQMSALFLTPGKDMFQDVTLYAYRKSSENASPVSLLYDAQNDPAHVSPIPSVGVTGAAAVLSDFRPVLTLIHPEPSLRLP